MSRRAKISAVSTTLALLFVIAGATAAHAGDVVVEGASIVFTKTVGINPNECAENNILVEAPEDGIVYYCYKMSYSGAISASCHSLIDNVLGSILDNIPGSKCCTNSSATDCADPTQQCNQNTNSCGGMYPVCASTTFAGVCCHDEQGTDCNIPHRGCDSDDDCSSSPYCVTHPIVADGEMVTRVITATVPSSGVVNQATWTAEAGICCDNTANTCNGEFNDTPDPCATDADCMGNATCRKGGIGLCCTDSSGSSCLSEAVCLMGRECELTTFDTCVVTDTSAEAESSARVGVFDTPAVSAVGMAALVLTLAGFGLFRVNRRQHA